MKPIFSVIIPVYNAERHLKACVDSVLHQTFGNFEILLIDDGSKDESAMICDKYALIDARIKVIHKDNGGVSSARNLGLDKAVGDWICFVDSDDSVNECWLENYADNLNADMISQGAVITDGLLTETIQLNEYLVYGEQRDQVIAYLESRNGILNSPWSKCYKGTLIRACKIRFLVNCHMSEDLIFVLQFLSISESLCVLKYCGYNYRRTNSNLTKMYHDPVLLLGWKKVVMSVLDVYCNKNRNSIVYKSIIANEFSYLTFYTIEHFSRLGARTRKDYYNLLRNMKKDVYLLQLPLNRYVFSLIYLPNLVFDFMMYIYTGVYTVVRRSLKK